MKTRPKASCSGIGASTISFAGASFRIATNGVAPLTSLAVCAEAESALSTTAMPITAALRLAPAVMLISFDVLSIGTLHCETVVRCMHRVCEYEAELREYSRGRGNRATGRWY